MVVNALNAYCENPGSKKLRYDLGIAVQYAVQASWYNSYVAKRGDPNVVANAIATVLLKAKALNRETRAPATREEIIRDLFGHTDVSGLKVAGQFVTLLPDAIDNSRAIPAAPLSAPRFKEQLASDSLMGAVVGVHRSTKDLAADIAILEDNDPDFNPDPFHPDAGIMRERLVAGTLTMEINRMNMDIAIASAMSNLSPNISAADRETWRQSTKARYEQQMADFAREHQFLPEFLTASVVKEAKLFSGGELDKLADVICRILAGNATVKEGGVNRPLAKADVRMALDALHQGTPEAQNTILVWMQAVDIRLRNINPLAY